LHGKLAEFRSRIVSLEDELKAYISTSCSTCELHVRNLEVAHYVDRLQDENDELRKMMGWLSGHEPQLRMMV
jgi:DNA-binding MarR family transcriptional regulator